MEVIDMGQDFTAIVDFAHTPNALKVTLETAREMLVSSSLPPGEGPGVRQNPRIIAVFGSAGLRDKEKRRMMAETSTELADLTVLTAEDPRTESLDGILNEMAAGANVQGWTRRGDVLAGAGPGEAIKFALRLARPGDIVLSCGKGHEQSMCFGKIEYPWDDRTAMRAALAEYLSVDGPQMPYLPTQDKAEKGVVEIVADWRTPVILTGTHVRLEPMIEAHIPGLAEIGVGQEFWDFMLYGKIETEEDMTHWVWDILSRPDLPFVVIHWNPAGLQGQPAI
jgi:hypothetical protein